MVKSVARAADNGDMIISDAELRVVMDYVRTGPPGGSDAMDSPVLSDDLQERILSRVAMMPDVREDRVADARTRLEGGELDSRQVADKIVARTLSDSIR